MGEDSKPRRRVGCWVAASVVLSLGAFVLVVPGFLASGRASNHRNAGASLKTIPSAEADFRGNDRDDNQVNDYWVGDVSRLYYLEVQGQPIKLIERSVADADGAPSKPLQDPRSKVGFRFAAIKLDETGVPYDRGNGRNPEKYGFCAYPVTYRAKTAWYQNSLDLAQFTYIVNEENIIWKKDLGGAPAAKWPKDPLAEGWSKLD
jgi:hypothetical protein